MNSSILTYTAFTFAHLSAKTFLIDFKEGKVTQFVFVKHTNINLMHYFGWKNFFFPVVPLLKLLPSDNLKFACLSEYLFEL